MIELRGETVTLRAFRPDEVDAFVASRMSLEEGVSSTTYTEEDLRERAARSGETTERGVLLAIDDGGGAVGEVSAYRAGLPDGVFGIGVGLFEEADRGRGLGTDAVATITRYAFDELGARRVEAGTHVGNAAMITILERFGFVREGVLRRYFPSADGGLDCSIYAMTIDDWNARNH